MTPNRSVPWGLGVLLWAVACGSPGSGTTASGTTDQCIAPCETVGTSGTAGTVDDTGSDEGELEGGEIPPGTDCQTDADCVLDDDCCHCNIYPGQLPADHVCDQDLCPQSGCDQVAEAAVEHSATCVNGNCRLAKIDCDPQDVVCNMAPPECEALQLPSVIDGCWGPCVVRAACEGHLYPGAECPGGYTEVSWSVCSGNMCEGAVSCEPDIDGCEEFDDLTPDCDCGFDAVCAAQGFECYDQDGPHCCIGGAEVCPPG